MDTQGNKPIPGSSEAAKITLISDREISITRTFNAPRPVVFDAWTKAEHVRHWWSPDGVPLAVCEIDLRPGGAFRFVHRTQQGEGPAFTGTYREIVAPERLVFASPAPTGGHSVGTLLFEERQGQTVLTLTIASSSKEARDALLKMRVDAGTARTLDNLNKYLEQSV